MKLPVPVTVIGDDPVFLERVGKFAPALPGIFERLRWLRLELSYQKLRKLVFTQEARYSDPVYYKLTDDTLMIFPLAFRAGQRIDIATYMGFGRRHWQRNIPSPYKEQWLKLEIEPDKRVVSKVVDHLKAGTGYKGLVARFSRCHDRLIAIHIANALIRNHVPPDVASRLDLYAYPPTADFVRGERKFSLKPLISAYRPSGLYGLDVAVYEEAFTSYCMTRGSIPVTELSVQHALVELFKSITFDFSWNA